MRQHTGESREWSLYWTAHGQPVPCRLVPVLAGWAGLDERESAAGIEPGHPILVDPEYRIDPVQARFLARSRFTWLAEGTRPGRPAPCSPTPPCRSTTTRGRSWPATHDPAKALCHPGRAAGKTTGHPDLDRCNPACTNIARTGEHIAALTAETARLRAEAASRWPPSRSASGSPSALTRWDTSPSGMPGPASPRKQTTTMDERAGIEAAMDPLLDGTPLRSDGKLTIVSLATEAGVKRHVLTHKHTDLKDRFNARVKAQHAIPASETALREQNAELRRKLNGMRAERDEYKQAADALARALNILTTENGKLRSQISRLSQQSTPGRLTLAD